MDEAKRVGREKLDKAREAAREVMDEAARQGRETLEGQRHAAAGQIHGIASALRAAADRLAEQDQGYIAKLANRTAEGLDDASDVIERHDVGDLMERFQDFARRQPALVLGGAVATGLILARFFTASSRRAEEAEWHAQEPEWYEDRPVATPASTSAGTSATLIDPIDEPDVGLSVPIGTAGTTAPTSGVGKGRGEEEIR